MESCDVLVVGGGPAGSSCAWKLRRLGLDVMVMDKARFPRHKVCAGWITPGLVDALELDTEEYRRGRTFQPITGFQAGVLGRREVRAGYGQAVSYGILRAEFDHYLLRRAGARVKEGTGLASLRRLGGDWIVNDEIRTPLVIGAGGHFCPVARWLGARDKEEVVVAAQEVEFRLDERQRRQCRVEPEVPELYFCRDLKGYGWCFRKEDTLNVGFGRADNREFPRYVREFSEFLKTRGSVPSDLPARWLGHAYLLWAAERPRLIDHGMLLIGDAAGLAYAQSGEGIRPAVESGLIAASVIAEAAGRYDRERLAPYGQRLQARFGKPGLKLPLSLPEGWAAAVGRALISTAWFTRRVMIESWFLHMGEPLLTLPPASSALEPAPGVS